MSIIKNLLSVSVLKFGSAQLNRISKEKILASDSGLSAVCYIALFWILSYTYLYSMYSLKHINLPEAAAELAATKLAIIFWKCQMHFLWFLINCWSRFLSLMLISNWLTTLSASQAHELVMDRWKSQTFFDKKKLFFVSFINLTCHFRHPNNTCKKSVKQGSYHNRLFLHCLFGFVQNFSI